MLQGQAVRWIKNMEAKSGLKVMNLSASDMVRQLESAVQFGRPVLLADIMEEIDPVLEPLLAKAFIRYARYLACQQGTVVGVEHAPANRDSSLHGPP